MTKTLAVTPQAYLTQVRMQKAKYLLLNHRDITIAEVAEQCGYTQLPNFTRAFKRYFGMKPSEMRLQRIDNQQFTTLPTGKGRHNGRTPRIRKPISGTHE